MIVDQLIQASSLLLSTFLSVAERPRVNVIILSASALVCILLSTGLAAYFGAEGAALGAIGGSLTVLLATLFMCWKKFKSVYI
jgi:Na+-driven multidrug efflux pump